MSVVLVVLCFSCIVPDKRANATIQCNVLEVPIRGLPHRYRNERVRFALEDDSLKIHSQHLDLDFARNQSLDRALPVVKEVRKQFVVKDKFNDSYKVLYAEQTWKSQVYLYLYIISLKHPAPIYLFTNDPNFNPAAKTD